MRMTIIILLVSTLFTQPLLALGLTECECCTPSALPGDGADSVSSTDPCCARSGDDQGSNREGSPQNSDDRGGCESCPKSCCATTAPIGVVPFATARGIPQGDQNLWIEAITELYADAPWARQERPPRASALV